jgi:hypothetical protein
MDGLEQMAFLENAFGLKRERSQRSASNTRNLPEIALRQVLLVFVDY